MNRFARGSEWRKWDLHIHTKETNKNDDFTSPSFNIFCVTMLKRALAKDIKAIGITDYFSLDNFNKIKAFVDEIDSHKSFNKDEKSNIKNILFLPNVELRILPATDSGGLINIHCIFNPDSSFLEKLVNDFFGSLEDSGGNKMNQAGLTALGRSSDNNLDEDCAYKKGIENFHLEPSKLIKLFKDKPELSENVIIAVSNSTNNGASALQEHYTLFENESGSLDAVRRNIYNLSDAIFSGNPSDREFFLGNKENCDKQLVINECGSLKPCIHGSDAHTEEKLFSPDQNRYCWIKADLTFEGLKQILCEPEDRVMIQANKPEEKSGYHVIKSIKVDSECCKQTIPLNSNLNTIIGGRSTGKSTLLQLIAYGVNPNIPEIKEHVSKMPQEPIKIIWQDNEENKDRGIEFFPQNYMFKIAIEKHEKDKLITAIVTEKDEGVLIRNYEKSCATNKSTLQNNIDVLFELQSDIDELTVNLKEKGDKSGLQKEIEALQAKIKDSHQGEDISEDELNEFENLKKELVGLEQLQKTLEEDKNNISSLKEEDLFDTSFNYKFNQLSEHNSKDIQDIFTSIKEHATEQWKNKLTTKLTEIDSNLNTQKNNIKSKKESSIYIKGIEHLEQNKQYKELNDRLNIENMKLAKITTLQKQRDKLVAQKDTLFAKTIENHIVYAEKIDELIRIFSLVHDDIEIKIEKTYLDDKCKGLLKDFINRKSQGMQNYVNNWGNNYMEDVKKTIEPFLRDSLEKKIELKSYKDIKDLAKGVLTENWFSMSYELTYQNDTFNKMSDGKKAFVVLKLLLEFSNKECPILLDQPEDSLDNRAIYNELVTYLKQKKKTRQIILVTHNANIVVNADAEEVIVANQHGEDSKNQNDTKFQYVSGSIENTSLLSTAQNDIALNSQGIREHVCEILEGGTEAFKKRENKYNIA